MDMMGEKLTAALRKLSEDIYSSDSRFALELIQNADDNIYANGILPSFDLFVNSSVVVTSNNEVGFAPQNVLAICNVSKSTKVGSASIGRKGIGFKSVFKGAYIFMLDFAHTQL